MKPNWKATTITLAMCMVFLCTSNQSGLCQQTTIEDEELELYFSSFNNTLFGLLQVLKKQQIPTRPLSEEEVERFQVIRTDCEPMEQLDPILPLIGQSISPDMVFNLIQDQNLHVQLGNDQMTFWIKRSCVRRYISSSPTNLSNSNVINQNQWTTIANTLYLKHLSEKKRYIKYVKRLRSKVILPKTNQEIQLVESKLNLIDKIYARIGPSSTIGSTSFTQKFSISGHLLFGRSDFSTNFTDLSQGGYDGNNVDVNLRAQYDINANARAGILVKNRSEVLLTPYQNTIAGAFYQQKLSNHILKIQTNIENYSDEINNKNNYGKTSLQARIGNSGGSIFKYNVNYQYLNQDFKNVSSNSYDRHHIDFRSIIHVGSTFSFRPALTFNKGRSDNASFAYRMIRPTMSFFFDRNNKSDEIKINFETTDFENLAIQNNNRLHLAWISQSNNGGAGGGSTHTDIGFIVRNFSNLETSDYMDVYAKLNRRINQTSKNLMLRWRHFPNQSKSDRWDIRNGIDKHGPFYMGYDINIRINAPTEQTFINQWDGYLKMGFSIKGFRFGPFWRGHVGLDFKGSDEGFFNSDQNNYQYGIETQGFHNFSNRVKLRYHAAYDFNTVSSRTNDLTNPGKNVISKRNPRNFQFDIDIGVRVVQYLEIFGVAKYFLHKTDLAFEPTRKQVETNKGSKFTIGVRLNYN